MPALEAGYDLAGLAACYLLIALTVAVYYTFTQLADILDVSILGRHPFGGAASAIRTTILRGCERGIKALEKQTVRFQDGLIDAFGLLFGLSALLYIGVREAMEYLWSTAAPALVEVALKPVRDRVRDAERDLTTLWNGLVVATLPLTKKLADAIDGAVDAAHRFTVSHVQQAESAIRRDLGRDISALAGEAAAAGRAAERYADRAVDALRDAENAAIAAARTAAAAATSAALRQAEAYADRLGLDIRDEIAAARNALNSSIAAVEAAETAGITAARRAADEALRDAIAGAQDLIGGVRSELLHGIDELAAAEETALSEAQAAADHAIASVRGVAERVRTDLGTIEGTLGVEGLAGLVATIPALAVLTHAIADEAGLGRAECRGKVKNICSVDPAAWAGLLAGVGALGMTLDLEDMVDTGRELLEMLVEGGDRIGLPV